MVAKIEPPNLIVVRTGGFDQIGLGLGFMSSTAIEKFWPAVPPQLFTVDGTALGVVTVGNSSGFKVKQQVVISASGLPDLTVKIMRFISPTSFYVGPTSPTAGQGLTQRTDISAYTVLLGAFIYAETQPKVTIKPDDIIQAVYRQEPGTTIGVELDDQWGNPYNANNPIPVEVITGSGGNTIPTDWTEIDLGYDTNQNLTEAQYLKGATLERTLNLSYDSNGNLTKVTAV